MKNLIFVVVLFAILLTAVAAHAQEVSTTTQEKSLAIFPHQTVGLNRSTCEIVPNNTINMFDYDGDGQLDIVHATNSIKTSMGLSEPHLDETTITVTIQNIEGAQLNTKTWTLKGTMGKLDAGFILSRDTEDGFQCFVILVTADKKVLNMSYFSKTKKS